jgi:hypothetical protein
MKECCRDFKPIFLYSMHTVVMETIDPAHVDKIVLKCFFFSPLSHSTIGIDPSHVHGLDLYLYWLSSGNLT